MPLVSIKNLSVGYNGKRVLEDISLDIGERDFIAVIGGNGGGKTTLVKALLKLIPYQGQVVYSPRVESGGVRRIGYLPQINPVDRSFPITVADVILSGLQAEKGLFGRYTGADRSKARQLAARASLEKYFDRTIKHLSGGEMQRVLLCRALISDPALLILDEPANYIDSTFERELYAMLKELNETMAIVVVSHNIMHVAPYVKSIACVNRTLYYQPSNQITPRIQQLTFCPECQTPHL